MTNADILKIARKQSALDANCSPEDFKKTEPKIVESIKNPFARKYLDLPLPCHFISYGTNIVASIDLQYREIVEQYINKYPPEHCFETPNMQVINEAFQKYHMQVCFMAEYFLPDMNVIHEMECEYTLRVLEQPDFQNLYLPQFSNALCETRKQLDVLAVGAYKEDRLVGLAGGSADCDSMWQIGIDVLPEERRKGIGAALVSRLALEILHRGKVPFYCCAWSNIKSARTAIKSGFRPAWVEMTIKPKTFVDKMNER